MTILDWIVIVVVVSISLGIGVLFSKRASESTEQFFVAGRSLPWWLAGTSIVATTFSADTPLYIAGLVRENGLAQNWFWLSAAIGGMCTVFFFAKLWRRAEVVTDLELVELRYSGKQAAALRLFLAVYSGIFVNAMIMGSITHAMATIARDSLGVSGQLAGIDLAVWVIVGLLLVSLVYSALSGIVGVVYTDLVQFAIAMLGSIVLAVMCIDAVGGLEGFQHELQLLSVDQPELTSMVPAGGKGGVPWSTFLVYILVLWWGKAAGGGYSTQRLLSTKDERHALLAMLWFNIAHYVIRPWPWIIVALTSMILLPDPADPEAAYGSMIVTVLPSGLRGLLIASLFAAFMSTQDTHLNWGGSYLVNDLYRRFIKPEASEPHYIRICRLSMILLAMVAGLVAVYAESIFGIYKFLAEVSAGAATAKALRWYWWRINAWSEISAMIAGFAAKFTVPLVLPILAAPDSGSDDMFGYRFLAILAVTTAVWIVVTYATSENAEQPSERLLTFYRRVRPGGPGWRWVARAANLPATTRQPNFGPLLLGWASGVVLVYAMLYLLGMPILFGTLSFVALSLTVASIVGLTHTIRGMDKAGAE